MPPRLDDRDPVTHGGSLWNGQFRDSKPAAVVFSVGHLGPGMKSRLGYRTWLPFAMTVVLWVGLVFAIAAVVSKTWADLFGLFYLLASPYVYRGFTRVFAEERTKTDAERVDPTAG